MANLPYSVASPILVELALTPSQGIDQESLEIDNEDIEEAEEKLSGAGVKSSDVHKADKLNQPVYGR